MKHTLSSSRIALGALAIAAAFTLGARRAPAFEEREVARLRSHFDSVLVELESRDVSGLTASQLAARYAHIRRLREYRDAGQFPRNVVSRERTPVFVDPYGTHCAMGYLVARDGRSDIVERIASTRNLARIPELADDAALISWLDSAGLTVTEAARIQPAYDGGGCCTIEPGPVRRFASTPRGYEAGTAVHLVFSSALIAANLTRPGRMGLSLVGATVGAAGIGLAASHLSNPNASRNLAAVNGAFAAASIVSAWRSARLARTVQPSMPGDARPVSAESSVTPIVSPAAVGLSIRLRL